MSNSQNDEKSIFKEALELKTVEKRTSYVEKVCANDPALKERILALIDVLKADAVEAESLTGEKDIKKAAKMIAGWGPSEVVLTHRDGILVYADNQYYEETFLPEKLIGRSGRGDTCIASYMSKRLSASPEQSIIWSAAVTSLKMEAEGPIIKTEDEVEDMILKKYNTGGQVV